MSKSGLSSMLKRAFHLAKQVSRHPSTEKKEALASIVEQSINRRKFLSNSVKSAALFTIGAGLSEGCRKPDESAISNSAGSDGPRIVIVGAGAAGLTCAYELSKAGYTSTIYEASNRSGGRLYSVNGAMGKGLVTDLGGEFIDANQRHLLNLTSELGISLLDRFQNTGVEKETYYFNNRFYTEADVIDALVPVASKIQSDIDSLPDSITADEPGNAAALDYISLEQYIGSLNCEQWLKDLLTVAYVTEYGKDAGDQSCINMLFLLSVNTSNGFHIFGSSNERYKVAGGTQSITNQLAKKLHPHVHYSHNLVSISSNSNSRYKLTFSYGTGVSKEVMADIVILAIPFTILRNIEIKVDLPHWKRHAINNLGYGTNAKLVMGYTKRFWQSIGKSGEAFTQHDFQLGWDSSELQQTVNASYSFYLGGTQGISLASGTPQYQFDRLKSGLESVMPGINDYHNGIVQRAQWPSNPYSLGSYSCFTPGQWTTICGNEGKRIGQLYFCGEHCSVNFQGFINGAVETGYKTAHKIIASL